MDPEALKDGSATSPEPPVPVADPAPGPHPEVSLPEFSPSVPPDPGAASPADALSLEGKPPPMAATEPVAPVPAAVEIPTFEPIPAAGPSYAAPEPAAAEGAAVVSAETAIASEAARAPEGSAYTGASPGQPADTIGSPVGIPTPVAPPPAAEGATETEAAFITDSATTVIREAEPASTVLGEEHPVAFPPAPPAELSAVEPVRIGPVGSEAVHETVPVEDRPAEPFRVVERVGDHEEGVTAAPEVPAGYGGYAVPTVETYGYPATESPEGSEAAPPSPPPPVVETGPNWMLAFVCGWSGGFSLFQIGEYLHRTDLAAAQRQLAMGGFASLGLGLLLFGLEALTWGKRREAAQRTLLLLLPLILTVIGLICLYFFHDPDPTKGRI